MIAKKEQLAPIPRVVTIVSALMVTKPIPWETVVNQDVVQAFGKWLVLVSILMNAKHLTNIIASQELLVSIPRVVTIASVLMVATRIQMENVLARVTKIFSWVSSGRHLCSI